MEKCHTHREKKLTNIQPTRKVSSFDLYFFNPSWTPGPWSKSVCFIGKSLLASKLQALQTLEKNWLFFIIVLLTMSREHKNCYTTDMVIIILPSHCHQWYMQALLKSKNRVICTKCVQFRDHVKSLRITITISVKFPLLGTTCSCMQSYFQMKVEYKYFVFLYLSMSNVVKMLLELICLLTFLKSSIRIWIQSCPHLFLCPPCLVKGRDGKTTSGNGLAWSLASPRGQWRTGKNGENWLQNHLWCPSNPRG